MPPEAVQRKASVPEPEPLAPTITEPSALTPEALLSIPPGRWPRPTIPPPLVQRKAWETKPEPERLSPTITDPSALTPWSPLVDPPPGPGYRSPRPTMPPSAVQ